jgi:hypothetical protein
MEDNSFSNFIFWAMAWYTFIGYAAIAFVVYISFFKNNNEKNLPNKK